VKTIHVQTELSLETLLNSLRQLNLKELELVERETAVLRAQQIAPSLSQAEADLLLKINQGTISRQTRARCAELTARSRAETLTASEEAELMTLVDEIERLNAERMGYLVHLAKLRQVTLDELMITLELSPFSYE
jgi:hypothetical protein